MWHKCESRILFTLNDLTLFSILLRHRYNWAQFWGWGHPADQQRVDRRGCWWRRRLRGEQRGTYQRCYESAWCPGSSAGQYQSPCRGERPLPCSTASQGCQTSPGMPTSLFSLKHSKGSSGAETHIPTCLHTTFLSLFIRLGESDFSMITSLSLWSGTRPALALAAFLLTAWGWARHCKSFPSPTSYWGILRLTLCWLLFLWVIQVCTVLINM